MDLSLREIFERARAAQEWVPPAEADLLFAVALRRAVDMGTPLSPSRVILREGGILEMGMHDHGAEPEEYRAPELAQGDPKRPDSRAQVYAAGAVGYELFTGLPPPRPPSTPGPELTGPLGDVVRVAMSPDKRERFQDLEQLLDAVSVIEPHRSAPEERGLLAALLARVKRWEERAQYAAALAMLRHEYETVEERLAKQELVSAQLLKADAASARQQPQQHLIERLSQLENAIVHQRSEAGTAITRLQQNLRELVEERRREEALARDLEEQREARLALHPPRPPMVPLIAAAVISAVIASIATAYILDYLHTANALPARPGAALANDSSHGGNSGLMPVTGNSAVNEPPVPGAIPLDGAAANSGANSASGTTGAASAAANAASGAAATSGAASGATGAPGATGALAASGTTGLSGATAPLTNAIPATGTMGSSGWLHGGAAVPAVPAALVQQQPPGKKTARQLLDRGDTALEKGRTETAITAFRSALATDASLSEAHRGLGMAYALQGNDAAAKQEYERYLSGSPNAEDAADIRAAIAELNSRSKLQ